MHLLQRVFSATIAFLIPALVTHLPLKGDEQPDYFSQPKLYSVEELNQELKERTLDMCWQFGKDSHLRFLSGNEEVYFELCLGTLPGRYTDFVTRIKDKFIESSMEGTKRLIFSYKIKSDGTEEVNQPQTSQRKAHPDEYSYIVADRRVIEKANPQRMRQEELATVIKDKKVLFYTGAGLSLASNVPAMKELYELLGLEENENFLFSLEESALKNPREFASKIGMFHKACIFSAPTKAHWALKELAVFKNIRMITENLDALHEASGICPYRINPHYLRDEVGGAAVEPFDYVICVGLSYDDRGFLGWYKQQNPQGKIIAVDLKQPSYLGDEDFLVVGDIQEIIPAIQKAVIR